VSDEESGLSRGGNPPWQPSEDQLKMVENMSAMGIRQDDMAKMLEIDPKTLRKHCRKELDQGSIKATMKVAQSLFKQATEDHNTAAQIFWMKARAGWTEKTQTEITAPKGLSVTWMMPPKS
jgi:DNA-binding XRE family transcriptional regulator